LIAENILAQQAGERFNTKLPRQLVTNPFLGPPTGPSLSVQKIEVANPE
jgi:hypothetical protein